MRLAAAENYLVEQVLRKPGPNMDWRAPESRSPRVRQVDDLELKSTDPHECNGCNSNESKDQHEEAWRMS